MPTSNSSQALQLFSLTYSPAFRPAGTPVNPQASRQELFEQRTTQVAALNSDGAIDQFERESQRMVTACKRVQSEGAQA